MIAALNEILMSDEIPHGERAVYLFFEMIALGFVLEGVAAFGHGEWRKGIVLIAASIPPYLVGMKWPAVKSKIGIRLSSTVETIASRRRYKWSIYALIATIVVVTIGSAIYRHSHHPKAISVIPQQQRQNAEPAKTTPLAMPSAQPSQSSTVKSRKHPLRSRPPHPPSDCTPASIADWKDGSLSDPPRGPSVGFIGGRNTTIESNSQAVGFDVGFDDSCSKDVYRDNDAAIHGEEDDLVRWYKTLLALPTLDQTSLEQAIAAKQADLHQGGRRIRPDVVSKLRSLEDSPDKLRAYMVNVMHPSHTPKR